METVGGVYNLGSCGGIWDRKILPSVLDDKPGLQRLLLYPLTRFAWPYLAVSAF